MRDLSGLHGERSALLAVLLPVVFSVVVPSFVDAQQQAQYAGNGLDGFTGPLGKSTLDISFDNSSQTFNFTLVRGPGAGNLATQNPLVLYIDTGRRDLSFSGWNTTAQLADNSDAARTAVSGFLSGGQRSTVNFGFTLEGLSRGFEAQFAIEYRASTGGALFRLDSSSSFTYVGPVAADNGGDPAAPSFLIAEPTAAQLQLNTAQFYFVATLVSETAFRSNEAVGDGVGAGVTAYDPTGRVDFSRGRVFPPALPPPPPATTASVAGSTGVATTASVAGSTGVVTTGGTSSTTAVPATSATATATSTTTGAGPSTTSGTTASTTGAPEKKSDDSPPPGLAESDVIIIVVAVVAALCICCAVAIFVFAARRQKNAGQGTGDEETTDDTSLSDTETISESSSVDSPSVYAPLSAGTEPSTSGNSASLEYSAMPSVPARSGDKKKARSHIKKKTGDDAIAEKYEIDFDELEIQEKVGAGAFGVVMRGMWRSDEVVVKQLLNSAHAEQKERDEFENEIMVMCRLKPHTNVLGLVAWTREPLSLVTAFMPHGSMESLLEQSFAGDLDPPLTNKRRVSFLEQIAKGMNHLAKEQVVHKDLASRNVLMESPDHCRVADMGLARSVVDDSHTTKSNTGPLKWLAFESIVERKHSELSDVWMFAATALEVITEQEPYPSLESFKVATFVSLGELSPFPKGLDDEKVLPDMRRSFTDEFPGVVELLTRCSALDPSERPRFQEISEMLRRVETVKGE